MIELFANSGDPDKTPCSVASDQGIYCLPVTRLGVSSLQWVNLFQRVCLTMAVCGRAHDYGSLWSGT